MENTLIKLIRRFLDEYRYETGVANKVAIDKYSIVPDVLSNLWGNEYNSIVCKTGIGAGSLAKCPFIIFMNSDITKTPTLGIYVVIIFKENMSGFYLMLNQGVTFLQYSEEEYKKIRSFWCSKLYIDDKKMDIKLTEKPTKMIKDYGKAYINADYFQSQFDSNNFMKMLNEYLDDYLKVCSIIISDFQNDLGIMYQRITNERTPGAAFEVAQLKEMKQEKSGKELEEEFIKDLKSDIKKTKGVVFFLGAGMSCALGLPDWNTLVFELLRSKWDFQLPNMPDKQIVEYMKNYSSPTALAAMVKNQYKEDAQFIEGIHDIFYEKNIDKQSLLDSPIGKIARKATARSTDVKAVITFNFDDYLEKAMDYIDCTTEYEVIYEENENKLYHGNKLPIYHVHGYIPQYNYENIKNNIIFTEKEYHELYSNFYNWTNIIQTKYLMDYTCVFLGLSFSDPNQRRILENTASFISNDRYNYLIVGNKIPDTKEMQECDNELNVLNSSWNEKNYRLKTYYINECDYNTVNNKLMELLNLIL